MKIGLIVSIAAIIFVGELPDKTFISNLIMSSKFRPVPVWVGAAGGFAVHVLIATVAGNLVLMLPKKPVEAVVSILFFAGGIYLLLGSESNQIQEGEIEADRAQQLLDPNLERSMSTEPSSWETQVEKIPAERSFVRIAASVFVVIFLAEWGDLTQILIANFTAKYHDPLSVGVGALIGLWASAGLATISGRSLLKIVPMAVLRKVSGVILVCFGIYSVLPLIGV